jgi:hypothetical protein
VEAGSRGLGIANLVDTRLKSPDHRFAAVPGLIRRSAPDRAPYFFYDLGTRRRITGVNSGPALAMGTTALSGAQDRLSRDHRFAAVPGLELLLLILLL